MRLAEVEREHELEFYPKEPLLELKHLTEAENP